MRSFRRVAAGLRAVAAVLPALLAPACGRHRPAAPDRIAITVPYEVDTLDPHSQNSLAYFAIAMNLYEPLVTTDADMEIQPCLAQRWENPNLSTWVFHLHPGVRFHSGKALTADDVVYSFQRLLQSRDLDISGYVLYIADIRALDPLTVQIRTTRPLSVLLNKVRFVAIVPKGSTAAELSSHPDGTGPYRLLRWDSGRSLRLTRYELYWGRRPPIREVEFRLGRDSASALDDLNSGRFALGQCNSRRLESTLRDPARFRVVRRPSIFLKYLSYDLRRDETPYCSARPNPFKNAAVRRALDIAIDRRKLIDSLTTDAVPATQLVPPFVFGFNPLIRPPAVDPGGARRLLAGAGYPDGFEVVLDSRRLFEDAARALVGPLREAGLRVRVSVEGDREFFARLETGDMTFHLSRFGCLTGDISDILDNTLHSAEPARHFGIHNYIGYSDPEVDREIEESAEIQGVNQRRELLQKISARLMKELVWVPLYTDLDVYAVERGLSWTPRNDSLILVSEITPEGFLGPEGVE
jgi:peptide/nickel transport system substrate-binding protein